MRSLVKLGPGAGQMAIVERAEPVATPDHVVVEVQATGVCGTDLHIADGEYAVEPGVTLGHELCGVVAEVGAHVDPDWVGRTVVAETFFSTCGHCANCRDGRPNLCAERRSIGTHVDGAFAPKVLLPVANLHALPVGISPRAATLAEPLACVCNCLLDPSVVEPGDTVLVTGPGAIGLLAAELAKICGGEVLLTGLPADEARLAIAREQGLRTAYAGELEERREFDVVIESSGSAVALAECLRHLRRGGRLAQIGIFGAPVSVSFDALLLKEVDFTSSFASTPRSWRRTMALLESGAIALEPLVTKVLPLESWERAFEPSSNGDLKIVLDPRMNGDGA
jgi:L-iditol 2-dehydrogenase